MFGRFVTRPNLDVGRISLVVIGNLSYRLITRVMLEVRSHGSCNHACFSLYCPAAQNQLPLKYINESYTCRAVQYSPEYPM